MIGYIQHCMNRIVWPFRGCFLMSGCCSDWLIGRKGRMICLASVLQTGFSLLSFWQLFLSASGPAICAKSLNLDAYCMGLAKVQTNRNSEQYQCSAIWDSLRWNNALHPPQGNLVDQREWCSVNSRSLRRLDSPINHVKMAVNLGFC